MVRERGRSAGFTLIECLVALAVTSLVAFAAGSLLRETGSFFDRGTRAVDETERFAWAVDRLTRDFAAARFVPQAGEKSGSAAFIGEPGRVVFVAAGRGGSAPEVVEYSTAPGEAGEQLIRRQAAWPGPSARLAQAELKDPVVLLSGTYDISFEFAQAPPGGGLVWRDRWSGAEGLPGSVKVKLIDAASGVDFLAASDFAIRANAPLACASGKDDCLKKDEGAKSAEAAQPRSGSR